MRVGDRTTVRPRKGKTDCLLPENPLLESFEMKRVLSLVAVVALAATVADSAEAGCRPVRARRCAVQVTTCCATTPAPVTTCCTTATPAPAPVTQCCADAAPCATASCDTGCAPRCRPVRARRCRPVRCRPVRCRPVRVRRCAPTCNTGCNTGCATGCATGGCSTGCGV